MRQVVADSAVSFTRCLVAASCGLSSALLVFCAIDHLLPSFLMSSFAVLCLLPSGKGVCDQCLLLTPYGRLACWRIAQLLQTLSLVVTSGDRAGAWQLL
jgi:hypothetical protein